MSGYVLAAAAESDLEAILSFIAERDGLDRALQVHAAFEQAFEMLVLTPNAGRRLDELTGESVRWWAVFNYLVLYEVASPLVVVRVLHGARDLQRIVHED